jgi:hypothetical protein
MKKICFIPLWEHIHGYDESYYMDQHITLCGNPYSNITPKLATIDSQKASCAECLIHLDKLLSENECRPDPKIEGAFFLNKKFKKPSEVNNFIEDSLKDLKEKT